MKELDYITHGTCSVKIHLSIEDGKVQEVSFLGGCNGNTKGICSLVKGMKCEDVLERLDGITCGDKGTSCPDQLCHAIRAIQE